MITNLSTGTSHKLGEEFGEAASRTSSIISRINRLPDVSAATSQNKFIKVNGNGGIMPPPPSLKLDLSKVSMPSRSRISTSLSPKLSQWVLTDSLRNDPISSRISVRDEYNDVRSGKINPEMYKSRASRRVDAVLSGKTALEDFVSSVEGSSGIERWAFWMEICGRMQIAQQVSHRDLPNHAFTMDESMSKESSTTRRPSDCQNKRDEDSLQRDRALAQSIMRKRLLSTRSTQTQRSEMCLAPFLDDSKLEQEIESEHGARIVVSSAKLKRNDVTSTGSASRMSSGRSVRSHKPSGTVSTEFVQAVRQNLVVDNDGRTTAMQLLFQTIGITRPKLSDIVLQRMASVVEVDLCRLLFADTANGGHEFVQQTEDVKNQERVDIGAGILGETYRRKKCVNVPDLCKCTFYQASDLGRNVRDPQNWNHSRVISCPVPISSGDIVGVILFARLLADFSAEEVEFIAWFAVLLGQIVENNDEKERLDGQIAIAENAANCQIELWKNGTNGCDVHDPRFWMSCFRSETAQVVIVYGRTENKSLLYCTSSDVSKDGVTMMCFPLRGICKKIVQDATGEPYMFSHAETVKELDRAVDLGGSEFEGTTSLLLVPVMSIVSTPLGPREKVIAIIGASSTIMSFGTLHLKMLQNLSLHVRDELLKIIEMWDTDETGSFNLSFVQSPDIVTESEPEHIEEVKELTPRDEKEESFAEDVHSDPAGPVPPQRLHDSDQEGEMLYDYSRRSIERMIEKEAAGPMRKLSSSNLLSKLRKRGTQKQAAAKLPDLPTSTAPSTP